MQGKEQNIKTQAIHSFSFICKFIQQYVLRTPEQAPRVKSFRDCHLYFQEIKVQYKHGNRLYTYQAIMLHMHVKTEKHRRKNLPMICSQCISFQSHAHSSLYYLQQLIFMLCRFDSIHHSVPTLSHVLRNEHLTTICRDNMICSWLSLKLGLEMATF